MTALTHPDPERCRRAPAGPTTLHLVDDDVDLRAMIASALRDLPCRLVGHGSAEAFLDHYAPGRSECLLLDVGLPGLSGLELLERLSRRGMQLPTLVLSARTEVAVVVHAMRQGAVGYLEKPPEPECLRDQVRPLLIEAEREAERRRGLQRLLADHGRLTQRERDVFELLGDGLSTKQVAHQLGLSIRTAHIHRANVMLKLRTETAIELARAAVQLRAIVDR